MVYNIEQKYYYSLFLGFNVDGSLITNQEIARILFQIAALLETMQCNVHRIRAYRRAALGVLFLPRPAVEYVATGEELPLVGVGAGLQLRIQDLVNTGHMNAHETLMEEIGEPMATLLSVEGVGPKTAIRLVRELQINSLQDLAQAAEDGRIRKLRGFGPKREARLQKRVHQRLESAA